MKIKEINYNGKRIKCEVKPDILIIVLLFFATICMPIYFLIIDSYLWAGIIHVVCLVGIIGSRGHIFFDYKPLKKQEDGDGEK